jgi:hypothetical protein
MSLVNIVQKRRTKMNDLQKMAQEKSVLQWGGLAGIVGGILLVAVFVIVGVFAAPDVFGAQEILRFPDIRAARTVENSLYLLVLALWFTHYLALYRALRETTLAPALFGSVLGILGLAMLAAGALPHVAMVPLSDLYHASGATPEVQETLVLSWQAMGGIFNALLGAGLFLLTIGLIALGAAMLGSPAFGKGLGWMTVTIGVVGLVATTVFLVAPPSPVAAVGVLGLVVFHLVLGWKVYRLSRKSVSAPATGVEPTGFALKGQP